MYLLCRFSEGWWIDKNKIHFGIYRWLSCFVTGGTCSATAVCSFVQGWPVCNNSSIPLWWLMWVPFLPFFGLFFSDFVLLFLLFGLVGWSRVASPFFIFIFEIQKVLCTLPLFVYAVLHNCCKNLHVVSRICL